MNYIEKKKEQKRKRYFIKYMLILATGVALGYMLSLSRLDKTIDESIKIKDRKIADMEKMLDEAEPWFAMEKSKDDILIEYKKIEYLKKDIEMMRRDLEVTRSKEDAYKEVGTKNTLTKEEAEKVLIEKIGIDTSVININSYESTDRVLDGIRYYLFIVVSGDPAASYFVSSKDGTIIDRSKDLYEKIMTEDIVYD